MMSEKQTYATMKRYGNQKYWLRARHKGIGASDAPAILGQSRFDSPYSVWAKKTQPLLEVQQKTPVMRMGHRLEKEIAASYPLRRIGKPEDIANAIIFFASEQADWISGQVLYVGGGNRM